MIDVLNSVGGDRPEGSLLAPETYRRALNRSRVELMIATSLFLCGGVLGAAAPSITSREPSLPVYTVGYFFRHNTRVLFGLWLGAPLFGFPTAAGLVFNGAVLSNAVVTAPVPLLERVVLLFPHAVFELPGIVVAGSVGFKPVVSFVRYVRGTQDSPVRAADLRDLLRLALISLGLIAVAGLLEATITPVVYRTVAG